MIINGKKNTKFDSVVSNVRKTSEEVDCSGASVFIIHDDRIVTEEYWGKHSKEPDSRRIQEDTRFHVASVRKSYIGFAVAYAVNKGYIGSIDDSIIKYLPPNEIAILNETTIRHLLTHTHGLKSINGEIYREFPSGENWAYRGIGINMLTQIVKNTTGKSVAEIVANNVFKPLKFTETGWYGDINEKLVDVIRKPNDPNWTTSKSTDGDRMNMYVSSRELAKWGYFHLKQGYVNGEQIVSNEIIDIATSLQSPNSIDAELPQNGYLWFVKDLPARKSEIGGLVPKGSFQILGYTGVTLLVIPQHNLVAVRAFNSFGSPNGFDYLHDVRKFGDTIMTCLLN
ncbi:CubicO group peptidase, beta-lactamase class C family [Salipaludibacillus aurantiacus]|uniref:CubicO group peptidase, beta-lactamase class C family n=2 Tax=Salipaludibacillus aurantiacus TaxID=1601833 RepID=A0A1H9UM52_9BACI|nr:CubicO group peptidase, beta-lactamase class C family [Salipaludibacillus aurantiacus]